MFWKKKTPDLQPMFLEDFEGYLPLITDIMSKLTHDRKMVWTQHGYDNWENRFFTFDLYTDKRRKDNIHNIHITLAKEYVNDSSNKGSTKLSGKYELIFRYRKIERKFVSIEFKNLYDLAMNMFKINEAKQKNIDNAELYAALLAALKKLSESK